MNRSGEILVSLLLFGVMMIASSSATASLPNVVSSVLTNPHNKQYLIVNETLTWPQAVDHCAAHNMTLAAIEDAVQQQQMARTIDTALPLNISWAGFWIGANDPSGSRSWTWVSNGHRVVAPFNVRWVHHSWYVSPNENCVFVRFTVRGHDRLYDWVDAKCDARYAFACERFVEQASEEF